MGQSNTTERPAFVPETYWDAEKSSVKSDELTAHLTEYGEMKAAADARKASTYDKPENYKLEFPADVKMPEGYSIDEKHPLVGAIREAAVEAGIPQDQFSKIFAKGALAMAAADQAQREAVAASLAERDKALGPKAAERVEGLKNFFKTLDPNPKVQAQLDQTLWTPDIIRVWETVAAKLTSQGGHGFQNTGREGGSDPNVIPGYDKMSFEQRRAAQWDRQAR